MNHSGLYNPPSFVEGFFGADTVQKTLENSPLRISDFHSNASFLMNSSVCVYLNDEPFIMLGYEGCDSSKAVADRLVQSNELRKAIEYFLCLNGFKLNSDLVLHHGGIRNTDIKEHFFYNMALIPNPNVPENDHGCVPGDIQALFHPTCLPITVMQQIVFYITSCNSITKCFAPNAKDFDSFELKKMPDLSIS